MSLNSNKSYIYFGIILIFFLSLFIFQQINLTTADIGRHITNGRLFIHAEEFGVTRHALLNTNLFSFTYPNFPFINHHWGSGIVSYFIYLLAGFKGLSFVYGLLIMLSLLLLFFLWKEKLPIYISFPIVLFLIPLIGERTEVRPESISYFFIATIISVLHLFIDDKLSKRWLSIVPLVSLVWVNTHIYFIFAPFFVGLFIIETLVYKKFEQTKNLLFVLFTSIIALCINPYWIKGLLYPFTMFRNYGYLIVENQSIPFLTNLNISNPNFLWWKITTLALIILSIIVFWKKRSKFPIALFIISTTFAIFSYFGVRHLTAYGLSLIPALLSLISAIYQPLTDGRKIHLQIIYSTTFSVIIVISIFFIFNNRLPWNSVWGLGLQPTVNQSADFIKKIKIKGPIFSNYDIGGYLIFHMFPEEKVFVDNRPEAYPEDFLQKEYIPMQNYENIWNEELKKWDFNIIWFNRNDLTPWAQKFLISRIKDSVWAPIFVDNYTIIFLRRNENNTRIIEQYELPKNMFTVR